MGIEAQTKNQSSSMKEFQSLLEQDFKDRKLKENQIVKATITEITSKFVICDLKSKSEAMIPVEEFKTKENDELSKLKVGDTISVWLDRIENARGEMVISRAKCRFMEAWEKLSKTFDKKEILTGTIQSRIKGGYQILVQGVSCFLPNSHLDIRPVKGAKIEQLMNTPIKVIPTRIDRTRFNLSVSRRLVLEQDRSAEVKETLKNLKENDVVLATVRGIEPYGIFMSYKSIDLLVHISDASHSKVNSAKDLCEIGDELKVKIIRIDEKTGRVSGSIKALTESPWENIEKKYKAGQICSGVCVKLSDFGAFFEIEPHITALCHNSQISFANSRNAKANKFFSISQKEVKLKILTVEKETQRIAVSYREANLENPWEKIKINSIIQVKIKNITDKALFCELDSGLIGICHWKEIDYFERPDSLNRYKKNDLIKVKIIDLDKNNEKLKLSIRACAKDPMDWFKENKKKIGSTISTKVVEVLKTGVKVAVDPEKKIIVTIKKNQLAIEPSDCRPEIYSIGNFGPDAKIIELDIKTRKIILSPKAAQQQEQDSLIKKFGAGAAKSGATLRGILSKALSGRKKKDKKE